MRCRVLGLLFAFACSPLVGNYEGGSAPRNLSYGSATVLWVRGQAITPLTPTVAGGSATNFAIAPALPPGMILDGASGTIAGAPSTVIAAASYVVTASNAVGAAKVTLSIRVAEAAPALVYAGAPVTFVQERASTTGPPPNAGGPILDCHGAGLPGGLQVTPTTCEVHGFPIDVTKRATYTITAHYSEGDVTFPLDLQINPPLSIVPSTMTLPGIAGIVTSFSGVGGQPPLSFRKLQGGGSIDPTSGAYVAPASGTAQIEVLDAGGSSAIATVRTRRGWANGPVRTFAVDDLSHSLFFGGQFDRTNYYSAPAVAAIQLATGAPDLTVDFQSGFDGAVTAIAADDTALYVAGHFLYYRGQSAPHLAKIDLATGALDANFNQLLGYDGDVYSLAIAAHHLYMGSATSGSGVTYRGVTVSGALQILSSDDGSLIASELPTLGNGCAISGLVATPDGAVAVYENTGTQFVIRYVGDTLSWSQPLTGQPAAIVFAPTQVSVATNVGLAAFDPATGTPGASVTVASFAPTAMTQVANTLYVANGNATLLAFDATTFASETDGVTAHAGFDGAVSSLLVSGDALIASGAFTTYNGAAAGGIIALNISDGAASARIATGVGFGVADVTTSPSIEVASLAVSGTRVFAGGSFALYQGVATRNLGRFDTAAQAIDTHSRPKRGWVAGWITAAPSILWLWMERACMSGALSPHSAPAATRSQ